MTDGAEIDGDVEFWRTENEVILSYRETFSWTVNGHENPVVPCVACGSLELRIVRAEVCPTGVHVVLKCRSCGKFPMHIGINERSLHLGSSFVTVATD